MGEGRCRCCCISYRTRVVVFAVTNVFITGVQLFLPLISTAFILYFQATKQNFEARHVLHEETMSIFHRIPTIVLRRPDSSKISLEDYGMPRSPLQSDVHVWSSWIFVKLTMLMYSIVLYKGAKKKNYPLVLCWFALNLPSALHSLLLLALDLGFGLMWKKPLNFQLYQYILSAYHLLGLLFVFFFLRRGSTHSRRGQVYHPNSYNKRGDSMEAGGKFRDPASLHL